MFETMRQFKNQRFKCENAIYYDAVYKNWIYILNFNMVQDEYITLSTQNKMAG